jgi:glucose-1-phosphate thymidylyltransferase
LHGLQVVLLVGGRGARLRPHTLTRPKGMLEVAGRPIVAHIMDELRSLPVEEVVFVHGHGREYFEEWAAVDCPFSYRFVEQAQPLGQAHAISLVDNGADRPMLIIFGDTIFKAELSQAGELDADGVLFLRAVDDPRRFGVAVLDRDGYVEHVIEKPAHNDSNQAIVGVYYIREPATLFRAIQEVMMTGPKLGGEFYLADALQTMIDRGARFRTGEISMWVDCGTTDALLDANVTLLDRSQTPPPSTLSWPGVTLIQPVLIDESARIERSTIGPHVAVGPGARVLGSSVSESIVYRDALIENSTLRRAVVGMEATVRGVQGRVNVSDFSEVVVEQPVRPT